MASYYYLISSLPMLRAGDAPPLDYAAFLDQCQGAVSDRVYRSLEELTVRSEDGGFVSRSGRPSAPYTTPQPRMCRS